MMRSADRKRRPLWAAAIAVGFVALLTLLAGADQPTPTPTPMLPNPTATADKPVAMPVPPPLSLSECQEILTGALQTFPGEAGEQGSPDMALRMIRSVENYLKFRDDLHTSLANYRWDILKSAKVENNPGQVDLDTLTFNPPVPAISALGFEARGGDVWLHRVKTFDENKRLRDTHSFDKPRLLQEHLPRREVFHLWRRTTISRIEVEYSTANPGKLEPVVVVLGGVTDEREYIKTAIYHLSGATDALAHHDWPTARESLAFAQREIHNYIARRQAE